MTSLLAVQPGHATPPAVEMLQKLGTLPAVAGIAPDLVHKAKVTAASAAVLLLVRHAVATATELLDVVDACRAWCSCPLTRLACCMSASRRSVIDASQCMGLRRKLSQLACF